MNPTCPFCASSTATTGQLSLSTPPTRKLRYNPDYATMHPSIPSRLLRRSFALALALLVPQLIHATTLGRTEATCTVCSAKSEQTVIGSTNAFGAPDLDLRPPEMQRSTMTFWVQECPHCGYCADDLGQPRPEAAAVVKSAAYQAQLKNPQFPPLANRFLCSMLVADKAGLHEPAIRSAHCAAWACDDANKTAESTHARTAALERLRKLKSAGKSIYDQKGTDAVLLADLARRSGDFVAAVASAREGLALAPEAIVAAVLEFEIRLAEQKDAQCHTLAELPDPAPAKAD